MDKGLDAISIRTVAAEVGVAPRTIQHHMGSKDELLATAFRQSIQRQVERTQCAHRGSTALDAITNTLSELLPIGPEQRIDAAAWVIFGAAASTRAWLAEIHTAELTTFRTALVEFFDKHHSLLAPALTPTQAGRLTTALVNGLTLDYLNTPASPETIIADLRCGLQALLPGAK